MILFNRDSAIQSASRRFCTVYKSENSVPCQPSGRRDIPSGCPSVQSIFLSDDENFPSGPSSVSRSFELLQLATVRTFQQYIQTPLNFWLAIGFPSKTQLWEDCCNRPDAVDSLPDVLIHKASIAFKIQTSGRQSSFSGCASIKYENYVHLINCLDNHPLSLGERSIGMKITCSGSTTVRTTRHHCPDAAQIKKEFQQNFQKADRTVVRLDSLWLPSAQRLGFIKPDVHWNL